MSTDAQRLAREIDALRREVRSLSTVAGLAQSSVEGGPTEVYDDDGVLRQVIGEQADGSYTSIDLNGAALAAPADPIVQVSPGLLIVSSYGTTADGTDWPVDFLRLDVHVSQTAGFTPNPATKLAEFTADGGSVTLALDPDTYYVRLVPVNTSRITGTASGEISAAVSAPVTGAGGAATYASADAPIGLGVEDEGALWTDTDNDNLSHRWDGFAWVALPVGPGATSDDVVAGKKVPLDSLLSLEWGVADPDTAPAPWGSLLPHTSRIDGNARDYVGIAEHNGLLYQLQAFTDANQHNHIRPVSINPTDGAIAYGPWLPEAGVADFATVVHGLVHLGTNWYVVREAASEDSIAEVLVYDDNWAFVTRWTVPGSTLFGATRGLTTDGTNLITVSEGNIVHLDPADGSLVTTITPSIDLTNATDIEYGSFDYGAPHYAVSVTTGDGGGDVAVLDATGLDVPAEHFNPFEIVSIVPDGTVQRYLRWDGTRFQFNSTTGAIYRTSTDNTDRTVWVALTYYDSIGGGETAPSPVTAEPVTVGKRLALSDWPTLPGTEDGGSASPDTVRVYTGTGATQPAAADLDLQTAIVQTDEARNAYVWVEHPTTVGGAAPPAASTFPAGPSGECAAEDGGFLVRGDSTGQWPYVENRLKRYVADFYATIDHSHPDLDARLGTAESRIDTTETDITGLDTRVDTTETDIAGLGTRVTDLEAAVDDLDARLTFLETPGPWHTVGNAGEPGFQSGFTEQSADSTKFRVNKAGDALTIVGDVNVPGGVANGDVIFRLPVGFRPTVDVTNLFAWQNSGTRMALLNIGSDGYVRWYDANNTPGGRSAFTVTVPLG